MKAGSRQGGAGGFPCIPHAGTTAGLGSEHRVVPLGKVKLLHLQVCDREGQMLSGSAGRCKSEEYLVITQLILFPKAWEGMLFVS